MVLYTVDGVVKDDGVWELPDSIQTCGVCTDVSPEDRTCGNRSYARCPARQNKSQH